MKVPLIAFGILSVLQLLVDSMPAPAQQPGADATFQPNNDRVKARNKIAAEMMAQQGIPIDDLYTLMEPHHDLLKDGTHYKPEGEALLIPQVTQCIQKRLEAK